MTVNDYPLVSIVTPSYNQAQFLEQTIQSVLSQDYPRIEYIVIDGASTDGSVDIIRKYADRLAYWVTEKDNGQSEAINKGLARANGEILAWLNSDDLYLPGCISSIVNAFFQHPEAGMIYGDLEIIDENGRVTGQHPIRPYTFENQLTLKMIIPQPAAFWRRKVSADVGLLRNDLHYAMDFEYWIRIGLHHRVYRLNRFIAQFRISSLNKGSAQSAKWAPELIRTLDDLYADPHIGENILKIKNKAYAGACRLGAATCLTAYEMGSARHWLAQAVRYDPLILASLDWWGIWSRAILGRHLYAMGRTLKMRLGRA